LCFGYALLGVEAWPWWFAAMFILAVGERPGVGQPKGSIIDGVSGAQRKPERWQPKSWQTKLYPSLALRGAIFGLPLLAVVMTREVPKRWQEWVFMGLAFVAFGLAVYNPALFVLAIAFAGAMPAASFVAQYMPLIRYMDEWRWTEALQYMIAISLCIVFSGV